MMKVITKLMRGLSIVAICSLLGVSALYAGGNGNSGNSGNAGTEVTGELVPPPGGAVTIGSQPSIGWLINRPAGHSNNGHGNNVDGVDSSNPGQGGGGPNGAVDESGDVDDEIRGGEDAGTNSAIGSNEIHQTDNFTGITMFIFTNDDEGTVGAPFPISADGSEFELWADIQGVLSFMDNMQVGGEPPTASFLVTTADPWVGSSSVMINGEMVTQDIYRTRADMSFSVSASVGNLSLVASDPLVARKLDLYHEGRDATFDWEKASQTFMDYTFAVGTGFSFQNEVDASSGYAWTGLTRLSGAADARVGVEKVQAQTFGGSFPSSDGTATLVFTPWTVGNASVIVWPVASGFFRQLNPETETFEVFESDQVFTEQLPAVYVNYRDLYPGSKTFVQIYKGAAVQGQVGMPILTVTEVPNALSSAATLAALLDDIAQNTVREGIVIRDVDIQEHVNYLGNGAYTLEILSGGIPWMNGGAYESLGTITFGVNQSVTVRGQIGTK